MADDTYIMQINLIQAVAKGRSKLMHKQIPDTKLHYLCTGLIAFMFFKFMKGTLLMHSKGFKLCCIQTSSKIVGAYRKVFLGRGVKAFPHSTVTFCRLLLLRCFSTSTQQLPHSVKLMVTTHLIQITHSTAFLGQCSVPNRPMGSHE